MKDIWLYINPKPKPRMTRWDKRPVVLNYWAWKEELQLKAGRFKLGNELEIKFFIKIPASTSMKRRLLLDETPHQKRPDLDNLVKAICDAFRKEDSQIWRIKASKRWIDNDTGSIYIKNL